MNHSLERLRAHAVARSLFTPTTLRAAVNRLGFIQADPIRSPARAQDLILRQRVKDYRAGDLERRYSALYLEEGVLYAYGFLPRATWELLDRRSTTSLSSFEQSVLVTVHRMGTVHPRQLDADFGRDRVINSWGGYSKATKCALERLHHRGLLRVAGRKNGVRIYEATTPTVESSSSDEGFRALVMVVARILAPAPEKTLQAVIAPLRRRMGARAHHRTVLRDLLQTGELEAASTDAGRYLWPVSAYRVSEPARLVRFLAPFDPVVWDRRRFEHLWKWSYRFEAYTPPRKRLRGYYAMPLLWCAQVIGWANVSVTGGRLAVELGFVGKPPRDPEFRREVDAEIARIELFLRPKLTREPTS